MPSPTVRAVRRWFALFAAGDHDTLFDELPDDVVWEPYGAGRSLVGTAEVRAYFARLSSQRAEAHAYSFEQIGRCVLVSGSLRLAEASELVELQVVWLYVFDDEERLRRATHFQSTAEARAAASAIAAAPLSEPEAGDRPAPDPPASSP